MTEERGEYRVSDPKYRRLGKFYMDRKLVMDGVAGAVLEEMKFTPWRAELISWRDAFEYVGLSFMFDESAEAESLPVYRVGCVVEENENGEIEYVANSICVERVYE